MSEFTNYLLIGWSISLLDGWRMENGEWRMENGEKRAVEQTKTKSPRKGEGLKRGSTKRLLNASEIA